MAESSGDGEIERQIERLIARSRPQVPATRRLLEQLPRIEEALANGVRRLELAELFGLTVPQFAAALAGARKLARQGGDGRRKEVKSARRGAAPMARKPVSGTGSHPPGGGMAWVKKLEDD